MACAAPHPGGFASISCVGSQSAFGWKVEALDLVTSGTTPRASNVRVSLEVPACPKCAAALERRHFWKTVFLYVSGFGSVGVLVGVIAIGDQLGFPSGVNVTLGVAGLLATVAAPVIWEFRHPPGFTITPTGDRVIYEFALNECAEAFASQNNVPAKS
jgi:hypothetical protein